MKEKISLKKLFGILVSISAVFILSFSSYSADPYWYRFEGYDMTPEEQVSRDNNGDISNKLGTGGRPYQQNNVRRASFEAASTWLLGSSPVRGNIIEMNDPTRVLTQEEIQNLSPMNMYTGVTNTLLPVSLNDKSGKTNWTTNMYNTSCPMLFADEIVYPFSTLNFPKCYSTDQLFVWFSAQNTMRHFAGAFAGYVQRSLTCCDDDGNCSTSFSVPKRQCKQIKCDLPLAQLLINYWIALDKRIEKKSTFTYLADFGQFVMPSGVNYHSKTIFVDKDYKTQTGWGMDWKMSWRPELDPSNNPGSRLDLEACSAHASWGKAAKDDTGAIDINLGGCGWSSQVTLTEMPNPSTNKHTMIYETLRTVAQPQASLLEAVAGPGVSADNYTSAEGGGYTEEDGILDEDGNPHIGD